MTNYSSDFLKILVERGFVHQCTDINVLDTKLATETVTAYIGFDCTADSLHVGSLLPIMMLKWLQKCGHKPIVLMGGGTTKVGDPSGKDESRKILSDEDILKNMEGIKKIFDKYLAFGESSTDAIMLNNDEWLSNLGYISFLRDIGPHFSINRMLTFESVKMRLDREQTLSFLEFNYMILQAYDFMELSRRHNCTLQMGGSDQWGNIVNGTDLARRVDGKLLFGLTSPLMTTSSGAKMGKTANGAVWLNKDRLSSYDYWQFWRNTEDADVGKFLRLFTELPISEIERLEKLKDREINEAKKILADEATKLCHGESAAIEARETARKTFEEGKAGGSLPTFDVQKDKLEAGISLIDLLILAKLCKSKGESRRMMKQGGIRLNDEQIKDEAYSVTLENITDNGTIKLSSGKKRHALIKTV